MALWGVVDGTRLKADVSNKPVELVKWDKDGDRAMSHIMVLISDEVLANSDTASVKQLWDSIASAYGIAKEENVYHIYHRIMNHRLQLKLQCRHLKM